MMLVRGTGFGVARLGRSVLSLALLLAIAGPHIRAERLPIKIYTTADGLAHNTINRIVKDSRGFLWFCTAGGLSRFDGYAFTNFGTEQGLPHSSVKDLLETRGGEYWLATDGGLVRFDPKGQPANRVVLANDATPPISMFAVVVPDDQDLRARAITVLREGRDGTIWVGTTKGLFRLEYGNGRRSLRPVDIHLPTEFPEQRIIEDVLEDARGSLWIAAPSGLYRRWPDGSAARYTTRDGLPNDFVSDLLEDHAGQLWAGTRLAGFFRFSTDASHSAPVIDLKFTYDDRSQYGLPTPWVFQLFETSDHRFLVATARGLVEFFPAADEHNRFRSYAERNGLSYFDITALNEDLGGNLWLGTNTAGAMKLTRGGFSTYSKQDGIETVNTVFEDRAGQLCFRGSVLGDARTSVFEGAKLDPLSDQQPSLYIRLGCFDGQRFDWFKPAAVTNFGWVQEQTILQTRNGEWWIGTEEGLYRFPPTDHLAELRTARPRAVYTTKDGLAGLQVFRLFEDSRGNVWISTTSAPTVGLARWERLTEKVRDLSRSPGLSSLKDDLPLSIGEDPSGNIWIGFASGLARYAQNSFKVFTESEGLPPGAIKDIHVDHSGRLWLASARGGFVRVDDVGAERPTFVSYTTAEGLSSNNTDVITEDANGRLYVGGGHGLDEFDPTTGRVKHFTTADGLAPGLFLAAFRDHNGALWFGMTSGLARLAPRLDQPAGLPPLLISGLRVSGVPQLVSALGEEAITLPDLVPSQNELQIDFVGLGFGPGEVLRYQYRLDGADTDWSALGEQRTVNYARLAPGRYTFLVRAVNSDGLVSPRPASVAFTILRPVWQRAWFLALAAIVVGLTVYALDRYRVARLLEMANMRTRIATDLHDDIGANLTRIALLSETAQRVRDQEPGPGGSLSSIARIARESVASMSDIVWAINPARDSLRDLTRRMRQHAEEVFTLRDINLRFDAADSTDSLKLGVDVRRDLLLIFKEAVNNTARHSRCSAVEISLRADGSRLVLTVVDNGGGFDPSRESDGQGLTSMKRRADRLNGTFEITSVNGRGTTVMLAIPV
jgi:signal transduction histidine kinase/ligand-binding sensor domain-containing protein